MKKVLILCWLLLLVGGCVSGVDPITGEQVFGVDPNVAAAIEAGVQVAVSIMTVLGSFWPILTPISLLAVGGLATWFKVKPKLTELQTKERMAHSAMSATVIGLDDFKEAYPEWWEKLGEKLDNIKDKLIDPKDRTVIENLIRAARGLPPKE